MKTLNTTLLYVTADGSYGDATDLTIVDASGFIPEDYMVLEETPDRERIEEAMGLAAYRMAEAHYWTWMTDSEVHQMLATLDSAITLAMTAGQVGLAEELGDVRDVLRRSDYPH